MSPSQLADIRAEQERQRRESEIARGKEAQLRKAQDENWEAARKFAVQIANAKAADRAAAAASTQQFQLAQKDSYDRKANGQREEDQRVHPVWWPFGRNDR